MKHAIRQVTRETFAMVCEEPGCEFHGETAVQGVCFTAEGEVADWAKLAAHEQQQYDELAAMRERAGDEYVDVLESHYVCAMTNWQITLDECIRLRRENVLLRRKLR